MLNVGSDRDPVVLRLLPYRPDGWREMRIKESAQCNADMARSDIGKPVHCAAAAWAKMLGEFSTILTIANEDRGRPRDPHLILFEVGSHAEGRARATLALFAVAHADDDRIA